ncbi:MAG: hypothetical protein H6744_19650 [Deltaproteobacteria bacterium]|nr:hypothetical protein [Deltaproteobacteria bacterium]
MQRSVLVGLLVVVVGVAGYLLTTRAPGPEPPPLAPLVSEMPAAPTVSPATPAPPALPAPPQPAAAPEPRRDPLLTLAHVLLEEPAHSALVADYLRGRGALFELTDADRDGHWDSARIDYQRDGTWDETWTREEGTAVRTLAASGDRLVLREGRWQRDPR